MNEAIRIARDVPLKSRNTFGVAATAQVLVDVADPAALPNLLAERDHDGPLALVLGGGSNVLFAGDPQGTVLVLSGRRISWLEEGGGPGGSTIVRADAGVLWHDLVMHTLARGFAGLENLALIPGTVGAAPIQNIGAYGVEVRDFIHAVEAFELATGALHRIEAASCQFAYRDSLFKRQPDRYIVTAVEFALSRTPRLRIDYAGLREELVAMGASQPTPQQVAAAVIAIRHRKLPDPASLGNAGSFFKNPIVPAALAEALLAEHPSLPVFRGNDEGTRKLSAAWLIDQCGWKGHREGDAGVAATHALVLVNYGNASGIQLLDLARRIADSVRARFHVSLEPEPRVIGTPW